MGAWKTAKKVMKNEPVAEVRPTHVAVGVLGVALGMYFSYDAGYFKGKEVGKLPQNQYPKNRR